MNLALNDPSLPSPGEMVNEGYASSYPHSISGSPVIATGDPHHNRAPSLGEIHQELEQEQEAQVNRLLHMIRTQQQQLHQLQIASGQNAAQVPVIDDSTPTSEFSMNFSSTPLPPITTPMSYSPTSRAANPRTSFDLIHRSRTPSRAASRTASPRMRATSISTEGENWTLPPRDENAFYQAETQMLTRENQMLRLRIRELERQVNEFNENSAITHEPATPSNLASSQARSISEEVEGIPSPVHQGTAKEE